MKIPISKIAAAAAALTAITGLAAGCSRDIPVVNLGIDDVYYIPRMSKLDLHPALTGDKYKWSLVKPDGSLEFLSSQRDYIFLAEKEGSYELLFEIIDDNTPYEFEFVVNVLHEEVEYSPYITKVYEYCPAPGQFINVMPKYDEGDTYDDILKKVEESISGKNDTMISLGGFGGYVTFGFDHTVINSPGKADFRIWGNAFYELTGSTRKGGSAEPGIVMVSYDVNCNGKPDDPWYELKGSEYSNPSAIRDYSITYHRPASEIANPDGSDNGTTDIKKYIEWADNQGQSGYMKKNIFHSNSYYPAWIADNSITLNGTLLPANAKDTSGNATYFVLYCYDWGYVDNHPNDYSDLCSFDIDNAVRPDGSPANLPGADFIRVYTGVNQQCGWLGETSTELCRAQDLNLPPQ